MTLSQKGHKTNFPSTPKLTRQFSALETQKRKSPGSKSQNKFPKDPIRRKAPRKEKVKRSRARKGRKVEPRAKREKTKVKAKGQSVF